MNPPKQRGISKISAEPFAAIKSCASKTVTDFVVWVNVPGCILHYLSMWLCFAGDSGLDSTDFEDFDVEVWKHVAREYEKQHQLGGHCAIIAAPVRRHGESP